MNHNKWSALKSLGLSFGLGTLLAFVSTFFLLSPAVESGDPSLTVKIVFWNMFLAVYLIDLGVLPACIGCRLAILPHIIIYGFVIGSIGYSIALSAGAVLIKKIRT